jgi:thiosulfate dehydrogenase
MVRPWIGLVVLSLGVVAAEPPKPVRVPLKAPHESTIPEGPVGEAIRLGQKVFTNTPLHAPKYSGNALSCSSCHLDAGKAPHAAPMVGLWASFPTYLPRAGRVGTMEDRINGCFLRSMNGKPLPTGSEEMRGLLAYVWWLSKDVPVGAEVVGRGNPPLQAPAPADPERGKAVYARACAACHGEDGLGSADVPPLWGPRSFNLGAGMARTSKAAAFVKANMSGLGGSDPLSAQDAYDVSAYFTHQPRPDFPDKVKDWPKGGKPADSRY